MPRFFTVSALLAAVCLVSATGAQAWPWRHHYQQYNQTQQYSQPAAAPQAAQAPAARQPQGQAAQGQTQQHAPVAAQPWPAPARRYSNNGLPAGSAWPVYPNYGNPVGAAYSPAAGLRPGQFFGTFGLRPADARARGAY